MKTVTFVLFMLFSVFAWGCGGGIFDPESGPTYDESLARRLAAPPYATWSPDGNQILYCQDGNIWVMDSEGSSLEKLIISPDENKKASRPDWKGNRITFQLDKSNSSEIWGQAAFSGMAEKIDFDLPAGKYESPAISPDGKYIVFTYNNQMYWCENPPGGRAILINVAEKIKKDCQWAGMYSWSKDGKIAFTAETSEGSNIYVLDNFRAGTITQITKGRFKDYNPSWSYDGLYLAFDSNRFAVAGEQNICLMMSDGSYLKKLADSGEYPRFRPIQYNHDVLYSSERVEGWKICLFHKAI